MKEQSKRILNLVFVFSVLALYYLARLVFGFRIPCIFRLVTGLKCPGCGISTVLMETPRLHFRKAFAANQFIFVTLPFLIFELIYLIIHYVRGTKASRFNEYLLYGYVALLVVWGIVRNLI